MNVKKVFMVSVVLIVIATNLFGELKIIENPATPPGKNAGRIVVPQEVMLIIDEGEGFFFQKPGMIKVAPDESIFVVDEGQFLRFDKNGKFLNNQQKKGEGPGEYTDIQNYQFIGQKIFIFTTHPQKIIQTDMRGKFLEQTRVREKSHYGEVFGYVNDKLWFIGADYKKRIHEENEHLIMKLELLWRTDDGKAGKTGIFFPEKWHTVKQIFEDGPYVYSKPIAKSLFRLHQSKYLYVSHTLKYLVRMVDLEKGKILLQFRRKYKTLPYIDQRTQEEKELDRKFLDEYKPPYFSDIQELLFYGEKIWVLTSVISKEKGVLVDVFNREGVYVDNFFLKLPQVTRVRDMYDKQIIIYNKFIYTIQEDEDGNPCLVKYKI